ncbi:MAG: hypothetical protein JNJ95_05535 [Dechloromonas sp.]|nr:hypothetical protein [Dechloromonas sp.]
MTVPAVTLRLKRFKRRFGITAPKVVVRSQLPWQWVVLPVVLIGLLLGVVGWLLAQRNEAGELGQELEVLRRQLLVQREELNLLRSTVGAGQSIASIERATQQQLLGRIKGLEVQNATLKEDVLLFERLIPVAGDGASVQIENFRVVQERPGIYRYRLLFAFQSDKLNPDFRGRLELIVDYLLAGKKLRLSLPEKHDASAEYRLELKRFLRRENTFQLPEGAALVGVEARVLQGDTLKSQQLAQL